MSKKSRRAARQAAEAQAQQEAMAQAQVQQEEQVEQVEATPVETPTPAPVVELDPEIQKLEAEFEALIAPKRPEEVPAAVPAEQIVEEVKTITPEQMKELSDVYVDTSNEQIKVLQSKVNMLIGRLNAADEAYRALQKERDDAVDKLTAEKAKNNDLVNKAVVLTSENTQLKNEKTKLKELCNSYALKAKHSEEVATETQKQMAAIQNQLFAQKDANTEAFNKGYEECRAKAQCAYSALEKKLKEQVEANESMKEYYSNRLTEYLKAMKASGMVG